MGSPVCACCCCCCLGVLWQVSKGKLDIAGTFWKILEARRAIFLEIQYNIVAKQDNIK